MLTNMLSLPDQLRAYYLFNVIVLFPDWIYIVLRPRTLEGGDLAAFFKLFNLYAKKDRLFRDTQDRTLKFLYYLGTFDLIFVTVFWWSFPDNKSNISFAIYCICREIFVATKTALYLLYSWKFIDPFWRFPIFAMLGLWIYLPLIVVWVIKTHIEQSFSGLHNPLS